MKEGSKDRYLKVENEVETHDGCCLLTWSSRIAQLPFLYNQELSVQELLHTHCDGAFFLHSLLNQENAP